jgi:hypothetical protein
MYADSRKYRPRMCGEYCSENRTPRGMLFLERFRYVVSGIEIGKVEKRI